MKTHDIGNDWFANLNDDGSLTLRNGEIGQRVNIPAYSASLLLTALNEERKRQLGDKPWFRHCPDFADEMPALIPSDWEDVTNAEWETPGFEADVGTLVVIERVDVSLREYESDHGFRFWVENWDGTVVFASDDWAEIVSFAQKRVLDRCVNEDEITERAAKEGCDRDAALELLCKERDARLDVPFKRPSA